MHDQNIYRHGNGTGFISATRPGGGTDGAKLTKIGLFSSSEQIVARLFSSISDYLKEDIRDSEITAIHKAFEKIVKEEIKKGSKNDTVEN